MSISFERDTSGSPLLQPNNAALAKPFSRTTFEVGTRLAAVISAAASFPDRVSSEFFVPVASDIRDVEPRVKRWLKTAAQDEGAQQAILEHLAVNGQVLGAGLRTVRLRDPNHLPSWAESLTAFLAAQPVSSSEAAMSGASTTMLASFVRAAHAALPRSDGRIEGVEVADEGYRGIAVALVSRLSEACDAAIRFELQLLSPGTDRENWLVRPDVDATQAGWLDRLEMLPALAFVIGVACEQWRTSIIEILGRLRADAVLLCQQAFLVEFDPLVEFKAGAGDRHADGRSVALLRFASGKGLVYKPKDLRHVEATTQLISYLNGAGLPLPLATWGVVCQDGYGWEERIDATPVADRAGFHRFYRRLGMLVRLMQLLNGRDLWVDNLIAAGEQPHLIDLECLFSPPIDPPPQLSLRRRALVDRMETTVVRTDMPLKAWWPSPEYPTRDIGCLSHAGDPLEAGGGALPVALYRPWTGAETADPWDHAEDVCTGYREMHDMLVANRDRLLLNDGPLHAYAAVRMRYIWRGTPDCHKVVQASTSPTALIDGTARETVLAALLRGAYTPPARDMDIPEIANAEIDAFRRLDVPLFTTLTTSSSLFTTQGKEIVGHFAGTGWDEVRRRIAALGAAPIDTDLAILRTALDAVRGGTELPAAADETESMAGTRTPNRHPEDVGPTADEVVEAVGDIADLLLDARRPPLGSGDGWLALLWWPMQDVWDVGPAMGDLVSGALGPALFLADYFALSGDPRSWMASRNTFDELFELAESSHATQDPRLDLYTTVPGGLAGPGALIYAAARAAVSLGNTALLDAARTHVKRAAAVAQEQDVGFDLAFGLAGIQLELLRLRTDRRMADADLDRLIYDLADRLFQAMSDSDVVQHPASGRLKGLVPVERDGVALALARTAMAVPEFTADRTVQMAALAAWPFDLALRGGRLASIAARGGAMQAAALHTAGRSGVADLARLSSRMLVLRAEEAQFASRSSGDSEAAGEARRCIQVLLHRRAKTGKWFPDRLADDRLNLSALDGVPALGSVLLRHLRPELPLVSVLE